MLRGCLLLLALACAGPHPPHDDAAARIRDAQRDAERARASGAERDREIAGLRARVATLDAEAAAARAEYDAALAGWRAASERRSRAYADLASRFKLLSDAGQAQVERRDGRILLRVPERALFAPGGVELRPGADGLIRQVAAVLVDLADRRFSVEMHADTADAAKGKPRATLERTSARALRVVAALQAAGVPAARLSACGMGDAHPIGDGTTEAGRALNRRVEIAVVPEAEEMAPIGDPANPAAGAGPGGSAPRP